METGKALIPIVSFSITAEYTQSRTGGNLITCATLSERKYVSLHTVKLPSLPDSLHLVMRYFDLGTDRSMELMPLE